MSAQFQYGMSGITPEVHRRHDLDSDRSADRARQLRARYLRVLLRQAIRTVVRSAGRWLSANTQQLRCAIAARICGRNSAFVRQYSNQEVGAGSGTACLDRRC